MIQQIHHQLQNSALQASKHSNKLTHRCENPLVRLLKYPEKENTVQHQCTALLMRAFASMEQSLHKPKRNKQVDSLDKKYLTLSLSKNEFER